VVEKRRVGFAFVVAGATLLAVGVLGLTFGWGSSASNSSGSTATRGTETPAAFFSAYVAAVRQGDRTFLMERMHPAVIARYGTTQCQAASAALVDPTISLRLVRASGPSNYDYASSGQSVVVPDTYTFTVTGTAAGHVGARMYHFALVQGRFRIFVDCAAAPG